MVLNPRRLSKPLRPERQPYTQLPKQRHMSEQVHFKRRMKLAEALWVMQQQKHH